MATVLVVDDESGPRESLRMILKDEFTILTADNGEAAAAKVKESRPDAVLLDIRLGRSDGIEVLRNIRSIDNTVQVAMITAYASLETARLAMRLGAVDYVTKPFDSNTVRNVVRELVSRRAVVQQDNRKLQSLQQANVSLSRAVSRYQEQMQENSSGTVMALITAIDAKDHYTRDHSIRVSALAQALGEALDFSSADTRAVRIAGLIHDIGKIGVHESILQKQGKLTAEEWMEMKKHPSIGAEIISSVPAIIVAVPGVLQHHERPDGKGYPSGLIGSEISQFAAVVGVADSIDAMSSQRSYSKPLNPERIADELMMGAGTQWNTEVVEAAIRMRLPYEHGKFQAPPGRFPFSEKW